MGHLFYYSYAYQILLVFQLVSSILVLLFLFYKSAPYGKFVTNGFGPVMPARPGWVIMEFPAFAVILVMFYLGRGWENPAMIVFICLWEFHYVYRTFIYPLRLSKGSRPMAVAIPLTGAFFNSINGYINGYEMFLSPDAAVKYDSSWFLTPYFIVGTGLFVAGWVINQHSDAVLRSLRKPGETGYKIPNRGLHKWVASPNYFGEFMEWLGWAVLTASWAGLAFAAFTFANLGPRAYKNLQWYKEKFGDEYPSSRKAMIPFVF